MVDASTRSMNEYALYYVWITSGLDTSSCPRGRSLILSSPFRTPHTRTLAIQTCTPLQRPFQGAADNAIIGSTAIMLEFLKLRKIVDDSSVVHKNLY